VTELKILILSHFDPIVGPKTFLQAPGLIKKDILEQIPSLMNLYEEKGFFVHIFKNLKSANLLFDIPNQQARGSLDTLLVSILITEGEVNVKLYQELLNGFAMELQKIPHVYKAFYHGSSKVEFDQDVFTKVQKLFYNFYESFPEESVIETRRDARIFVFGLSRAGKTTIIQSLQRNISNNTVPTTNVNISRILVNNLSIITYDAPGQVKLMDLWESYLNKQQDGLVFVIDVVHRTRYENAKDILHKIALKENLKTLPLLILVNKVDLVKKPNINDIKKVLAISELGNRPIKIFLTSGVQSMGINEAFNWLGQELANIIKLPDRVIPESKIDEGIIFSRWDEELGLEILGVHPHYSFNDPEVIAIRCFSTSQFVFGGTKFEKVSFILPFTHLKAKAAIYFDVIQDDSVRGGKLPFSLVIFYNDKTPKDYIEYFDTYIFKKLDYLKKIYPEKLEVADALEEIYLKLKNEKNKLLTKLESKPGDTKQFTQETVEGKSRTIENFEKFIQEIKMDKYFEGSHDSSSEKSSSDKLICELCRKELKEHINVYDSDFIIGFVCDECYLSISRPEIDFMINIFRGYGGYFGKDKVPNRPHEKQLELIAREIKAKKNQVPLDTLELQMIYKMLINGISLENYDKILKIISE